LDAVRKELMQVRRSNNQIKNYMIWINEREGEIMSKKTKRTKE